MKLIKTLTILLFGSLLFLSASAAPSPWDSWRAGYTNFERGETLREKGSYSEALTFFEKARKNYLAVRAARPDWNQRVIADRLRDCDRQIAELRRLLESSPQSSNVSETPASSASTASSPAASSLQTSRQPSTSGRPASSAVPAPSRQVHVRSAEDEQTIAKLKQEIVELRLRNEQLSRDIQKQRNFEAEIAALLRDQKVASDRYALLEKRYKAALEEQNRPDERIAVLEQRLISEKMTIERLEKKITSLEQQLSVEKENVRLHLAAKKALEDVLRTRNEELKRANQEHEAVLSRLKIIEELQEKLAELTRALQAKEDEIALLKKTKGEGEREALAEIAQLNALKKEIEALKKTIDSLRTERDAALLDAVAKQNRIDTLIAEQQLQKSALEQERSNSRITAAELANLRERNRSLEADIKLVSDRASDLERRLSLRDSADFQAATAARNSVKQLEKDLLNAQNELVALRAQLDSTKSSLTTAEQQIAAVKDENLKLRAELVAAKEREQNLLREVAQLRSLKNQFASLQRDFNALAAENRENKALLEAARPKAAELERAKLRLLDNDRLKEALAREQQLNAELQESYKQITAELQILRKRAADFEASRRRLVELEAIAKEADRLKNLEKEIAVLREREVELTNLKIRFAEAEGLLRTLRMEREAWQREKEQFEKRIAELRRGNDELERSNRKIQELEAMLSSRDVELAEVHRQLQEFKKEGQRDLHVSCRAESEKLRKLVESLGPLNDQIRRLQQEIANEKQRYTALSEQQQNLIRQVGMKDSEIRRLRQLNEELAAINKKSAADLLERVDAAKVARLEDELAALNKLNAELISERDRYAAQLANRDAADKDEKNEVALQSDRSPEDLAGAGLSAEQNGKYELAIWHYRQALANAPDFVPAHLRLGMIFLRRGSFSDAAKHLSVAQAADPQNFQLALDTARAFIAVERYGNAKAIIDPLLVKYPENAFVLMCAGLIEAGCGAPAKAEEKLLSASRLAPDSPEILLELARLLANSLSDRNREAVIVYEKARKLGLAPDPALEKKLGSLLDDRRQLVSFMAAAAREAEVNNDWSSAVWYYKKIMEDNHPEYVPLLAFAQWKSGSSAAARETLEFNSPSRKGMVVLTLISLAEKDFGNAVRAAQQSAGAKIPADWVGINVELNKIRKKKELSAAEQILMKSLQ